MYRSRWKTRLNLRSWFQSRIGHRSALYGLACFFLAATATASVRVDGLAVLVAKTALTLQDVYFFRSVQRLKSGDTQQITVPETGKALGRSIRQLVFEEMVIREIRSQGYAENQGVEQADKAWKEIRSKHARELKTVVGVYQRSEKAIQEALKRSFLVETFVQKKAETLTPGVTTADVDRYLRQNSGRLQGDSQKVRAAVEGLLRKERMQQGLEEWIRGLRDKYQVVQLVSETP